MYYPFRTTHPLREVTRKRTQRTSTGLGGSYGTASCPNHASPPPGLLCEDTSMRRGPLNGCFGTTFLSLSTCRLLPKTSRDRNHYHRHRVGTAELTHISARVTLTSTHPHFPNITVLKQLLPLLLLLLSTRHRVAHCRRRCVAVALDSGIKEAGTGRVTLGELECEVTRSALHTSSTCWQDPSSFSYLATSSAQPAPPTSPCTPRSSTCRESWKDTCCFLCLAESPCAPP